ncbi:MAG: SAM-dependent methyltransferase [Prevotella sp.]|nr:SAM-dependent methyltransferase [Prevotella sp.]
MNEATQAFIREHRNDDVRSLALKAHGQEDIDLPLALDQIAGWQTARRKLPSWAAVDGLRYPPHLSMEQCSSEQTALYKSRLVASLLAQVGGENVDDATVERLEDVTPAASFPSLVDLTGGFGVDFSFMARPFAKATYVERQPHLCALARHNFPLLNLTQAIVRQTDAETFLEQMAPATVIFLDPARRDTHGQRTFAIADCTPDASALKHLLVQKAQWVMLKLSPMLDWHKAVDDQQPYVRQVHIVAVGNECKELLLLLSRQGEEPLEVFCVNDEQRFAFVPSTSLDIHVAEPKAGDYLYEPNAAIMKAGCFAQLTSPFSLGAIGTNSHLFVAPHPVDDFPGRRFVINVVSSLNKKELRRALQGVTRANIAVRNFPLSAADLRRRLKLADGGDHYLFGTTTASGEHCLLVCTKV